MTIYRYQPVSIQFSKTLPCPECGKRLRRQRTFQQTINPWNKNTDGTPKTYAEVRAAVIAAGNDWRVTPEHCKIHEPT